MQARRVHGLLAMCALAVLAPSHARAEFYRWTDARGQVRISNIPPQGIGSDGRILPRYNPSSIAAQSTALRVRLQARDAALEAAASAVQSGEAGDADAGGAASK